MKWIYWKRMRGMRFYRNSSLMVDFSTARRNTIEDLFRSAGSQSWVGLI